jgi:hypothetical protein
MSQRLERKRTIMVAPVDYRPWSIQRLASRSRAQRRIVVAARQVGKTYWAAYETLRTAANLPGSKSLVVAPNATLLRNAIDKLIAISKDVPAVRWKERKQRFELTNGATIQCVSAEAGDAVRGWTVNGILWLDEAALMKEDVYTSAVPTTLSGGGRVLITTTPVGKNWVWKRYTGTDDKDDARPTARLKLRAQDSPYVDRDELARQRKDMSPERAAQDLDAVFVDELLLAFPDTSKLFTSRFPDRSKTPVEQLRNVLGVDLGKEQDWLVVTLMNKFGEAQLLGRWQHRTWPESVSEIARFAHEHRAVVYLDEGPGGGAGGVVENYLTQDHKVVVRNVRTAQTRVKKNLVEQLRADVQWQRVWVLDDPARQHARELVAQLRHELSLFQGLKKVHQGQETIVYAGPSIRGEHDDCVISLCLANWGRVALAGTPADIDGPEITPEQLLRDNLAINRHFRLGGGFGAFWPGVS